MKSIIRFGLIIMLAGILIPAINSCKRSCPPEVITAAVTNITPTDAVSGGEVTDQGCGDVLSRGVCWSTSQDPDITDNKTTDGQGTGTFISTMENLTANTPYYVRAYATNEAGTGYGEQIQFTTDPLELGSVTTTAVEQISATTAVARGNITSAGGGAILAGGVCWKANIPDPTVNDSHSGNGTAVGEFSSNILNLLPGTTYYLRAYITNNSGTAYGEQIMFCTDVTDIDNNVYNAVTIGSKIWLAENLKTTKLNDGTEISNVTGNAAWAALNTPGYCWFNNNVVNKDIYGGLYNWYAVNTQKLCPTGWHVPTDAEWTTLADALGGTSVAGGKMKETGTSHWSSPNTDATNQSGFTALPAGYRNFDGEFNGVTGNGNWRSSTPDPGNPTFAWYRYIYNYSGNIYRGSGNNEGGFSVRCLKN